MPPSTVITALQLPFLFDPEKLVQEVQHILASDWVSHFNPNDYEGDWKLLALYAPNGDEKNIFAMSTDTEPLEETSLLQNAPYLRNILPWQISTRNASYF